MLGFGFSWPFNKITLYYLIELLIRVDGSDGPWAAGSFMCEYNIWLVAQSNTVNFDYFGQCRGAHDRQSTFLYITQ